MALPILPLGDRAILVTLGDRIDSKVNDQVVALYQRLVNIDHAGIDFFTPAFCSLGVGYDPVSYTHLTLPTILRV